jgi:copper chaperone NosL
MLGELRVRTWKGWRMTVAAMTAVVVSACAIEPQTVHLGSEECAHCRMVITEPQFAAQALNSKGKAFKFDAVECLASWVASGEGSELELHSLWVADHEEPSRWLRVEEARFLRSDAVHTPMGAGVVALRDERAAREHLEARGGELLHWSGVLTLAASGTGHPHHPHGH